jgi:hypothetical protein
VRHFSRTWRTSCLYGGPDRRVGISTRGIDLVEERAKAQGCDVYRAQLSSDGNGFFGEIVVH